MPAPWPPALAFAMVLQGSLAVGIMAVANSRDLPLMVNGLGGRGRRHALSLRGGMEMPMNDGFRQGSPSPMAIKRIKGEIAAMESSPPTFLRARPLDGDLLDWHFALLGGNGTSFEGGIYHGRITLDYEYPMKPPRIYFYTESGRFETGVPICLSMTSHHQETWQPTWDVRTALTALQGFMETFYEGAVGGMDMHPDDQAYLARLSRPLPAEIKALKREGGDYDSLIKLHRGLHKELCDANGIPIVERVARRKAGNMWSAGVSLMTLSNMLSPNWVASWVMQRLALGLLVIASWLSDITVDLGVVYSGGKTALSGGWGQEGKAEVSRLERELAEARRGRDDGLAKLKEAEEEARMSGEHIGRLLESLTEAQSLVQAAHSKLSGGNNTMDTSSPAASVGEKGGSKPAKKIITCDADLPMWGSEPDREDEDEETEGEGGEGDGESDNADADLGYDVDIMLEGLEKAGFDPDLLAKLKSVAAKGGDVSIDDLAEIGMDKQFLNRCSNFDSKTAPDGQGDDGGGFEQLLGSDMKQDERAALKDLVDKMKGLQKPCDT